MTRYLEIKPGSIAEVAIRLRDDYQAFFKKELEKTGKGIAQMSDAEKKAFFNRVDKAYNAKNEQVEEQATVKSHTIKYINKDTGAVSSKTISGSDREDILKKTDEWKKNNNVTIKSVDPVFKNEQVEEQAKNPYAIGMAAAMKATGDKPPLKKSTITKAHDIAKKIEKQEEVEINEGQYKEIDTRKGDLRIAKDKRQALKDKYNAIMAGQASGDEHAVEAQIQKLNMSIKKQEDELIDIMKKSKETKKESVENIKEAAGPDRITNLNDKITRLQLSISKLDKSKPESKTKEAILKSDLNTAKLRLTDIMKQNAAKAVSEAIKAKQSYKTLKMSLKKEQETDNKKKTLTDKPLTKIEVNPKIEG